MHGIEDIKYDGNSLEIGINNRFMNELLKNQHLWFLCQRLASVIEIDRKDDLYWCFETFLSNMVRFTPWKENQYILVNRFDYEGIMGQKLMALAEIGDALNP